ncbi:MAG: hypothetical protein DDT42_01881 [candidate division WS2 bacterium]|uniref:Uncharacterized protein n=1 Tax=Psychracetigena formicireducens TaxID=2986056 RepID=A0A9E2BJ21_PSYF1|nr:hypothetical protein [Candidatus Psychracetigena formicireducens]
MLRNDTLFGNFQIKIDPIETGKLEHIRNFTYRFTAYSNFVGIDTLHYYVTNEFTTQHCYLIFNINATCNFFSNPDSIQILENQSARLNVMANDSFCSLPAVLEIPVQPTRATVSVSGQELIINPQANYWGNFKFGYRLNNSVGNETSTSEVLVKVIPDIACKESFIPMGDNFNTPQTDPIIIPFSELINNDNACPGDKNISNVVINLSGIQYGTISVFGDYFIYTPNPNSQGRTESISYSSQSNRFPEVRNSALIQIRIE